MIHDSVKFRVFTGFSRLAETTADKQAITNAEKAVTLELQSWSDLPAELLELIMSCLTLEENIRASAVCKRWYSVAIATRVVNQTPWIMFFPKVGDTYEFYDPLQRETYCIDLPELCGSRVCSTIDGWLLLYRPRTHRVFFFNPFTRESIKLPRYEMSYQIVSVSAAPTSASCIVFTIKHISPTVVAISTCHAGATEWTTVNHQNRLPFGFFDPDDRSWDVLSIHPPKCPENFFTKNWWKGKFMLEHQGELFVIYTCSTENPIVFKLDRNKLVWEEMKTLDDTIHVSSIMTGENKIPLRAFGLYRHKTSQPSVEELYCHRPTMYALNKNYCQIKLIALRTETTGSWVENFLQKCCLSLSESHFKSYQWGWLVVRRKNAHHFAIPG
ncbi:F-box/kelch-repeat protein [Vitis vinifera]|uniref:F-box/kelch-repeat protein n=1 Tax=Vitis vinifera TaxID=29760 RepID=A0A438EK52_VITVI|nr:F-box/kelch-repeat protein [Vitis vinifera]